MRKTKTIVWGGVLIVVGGVLAMNWNHWFGDLMEPEYRLPEGIQRVMMMPAEDGVHGRTLTWVSGEERDYSLRIGGAAGEGGHDFPALREEIRTHGGLTYVYSVSMDQLVPDRYGYEIRDSEGLYSYRDSIWVQERDTVQDFVLIGDLQDWNTGESAPFVQHVYDRYPDMDAWLFIGDQLERPQERFWNVYYETIRPFAPTIPIIAVAGNHEYEWGLPFVLGPRWRRAMRYPGNGPKGQEGKSFYIDYPHVRIVCLDTNILYAHLGSVREWLRFVLTERSDDPFLIVMGHHGVYSVRRGRLNMLMRYAIRPILEEAGVDLVLSGHDHSYARDSEPLKSGVKRRLPVYVTTTSAWKTYPVADPSKHVVSLSGERTYQHIRITADSLYFSCYRTGDDVLDTFAIGK